MLVHSRGVSLELRHSQGVVIRDACREFTAYVHYAYGVHY